MDPHNLYIYNSLTSSKEKFKPLRKNSVGMYVCGPTVYSNVHLGNCRTFISFDIIFRYLRYLGYNVRYVRNITDVGHLEDTGEDKISKKAKVEKLEPMEIAQKYTNSFREVLKNFNVLDPSIEPVASGHITEQISIIEDLIEKNLAYTSNGSVYFDISKYNETDSYGKLSGRDLEKIKSNSRDLSSQDDKKNEYDFALWKKAEKKHLMKWRSPWSEGFPGWHLECTAMSNKYLGDEFDIHGGGIDLKFPHHDCEIAQAVGYTGKQPAKFWIHANMLTLNSKKMSKSLDNNILPDELFSGKNDFFSKPYDPNVIRFFFLQAHYRSELDISEVAINASEKGFERLVEMIDRLKNIKVSSINNDNLLSQIKDWEKNCFDCLDDDFNSPMLIAEIFNSSKLITQIEKGGDAGQRDIDYFLGLFDILLNKILGIDYSKSTSDNDSILKILLNVRDEARAKKDFPLSDSIRDQLNKLGVKVNDKD
jgi:cysteinyl-tRNA synthetase